MLDLNRQNCLIEFAQHRPIPRQVDVLDELLGDGAAALVESEMDQVVEARLPGAQQVQTAVLVETPVLHGDRGLSHRGRDLTQGHDVAPFGTLMNLGQQHGPRSVVNAGRKRQAGRAQVGGGWKAGPDIEHPRENHEQDRQEGSRHDHPGLDTEPAPVRRDAMAASGAISTVGLESISTGRAIRFR